MESQSGNLGLGTSLIIPLTLRKYTQKSNRPNIYPLFFIQIASDLSLFSPPRGLYPSEVREKTYTSLTTPGLYFISSRKCKIAQSAIYQKISRHLKLFLNIIFVKSPPQQFSVHFFCSPPTFFSSHPEKNIILSPLSRRHPPSVDRSPGIFFYSPPLLRARRPDWQAASTPVFPRWARNCASLHTAHRTLPRRARKTGSRKGKIGGFHQKTGVFRRIPPFLPAGTRTRGASAHKKKDCTPIHLYSPLYFNPNRSRFGSIHRGKCLFHGTRSGFGGLSGLLRAFLGSGLGFGTGVLRVAFHNFGATLCSSFGFLAPSLCLVFGSFRVGSSGFGVLLCGRFGFCSSFATDTFLASLLGLFHLFAGSGCGFLTLAGGLFGTFLTARLHFLLGSTGIYLDHLGRSSSAYRENGGESQTTKHGIQIKFHCPVVLVVSSVPIEASSVRTRGVIFYRRLFFPVYDCKCSTKARRKQIKTSDYSIK